MGEITVEDDVDCKVETDHTIPEHNGEDDLEEDNVDEEYLQSVDWLQKEKHIFILSESGKPIYTRYGTAVL